MRPKPTPGTGDPSPRPPDDPEQSKRFEEKAREIEADVGGRAFTEAMDKAVPVKTPVITSRAEASQKSKKTGKSNDKPVDVDKRTVVDRK